MASNSGVADLISHITAVTDDPSLPLDAKLFGVFDRIYTDALSDDDRQSLLNRQSGLIPTLRQDPKPATELILNLIRPESYRFAQVLRIQPNVDLIAGLCSPNSDVNLVTLSLLNKACSSSGDAGIIAASPETVAALVRLWLSTPATEVATKGLEVISGLLRIDANTAPDGDTNMVAYTSKIYGQGLMWRRVFHDKDVYELFFSICSLATAGQEGQPSKREKTISQARLLDFILAFSNFEQISSSQLPGIEKKYGLSEGGLLDFAAVHMIDWKDDLLMHASLIDFLTKLLRGNSDPLMRAFGERNLESAEALDFLISRKLHSRTMSYYLELEKHESIESTYLYPLSAQYISTYASCCSSHLLDIGRRDVDRTLERLSMAISGVPVTKWARVDAPKSDLHVLSTLPRVVLLHTSSHNPLYSIPVNPPNADALNTLAAVFRGPPKDSSLDVPNNTRHEAAAARVLYFLYAKNTSNLWQRVVDIAETIAIKENALAAINLIDAVLGSYWEPLPERLDESMEDPFSLPIAAELDRQVPHRGGLLAASGTLAILTGQGQTSVIPYLLKPAQTFGRGDTQSAAYAVAVAKHETVVRLVQTLKEQAKIPEIQLHLIPWQPIITEIEQCANRGVWGGSTAVGARIGTLEL
ncbi:hypothetical protein MMC26_005470 [Xylographa opegraphella]|nr:hypothetical protein [Xylographa opegraphella]